MYNSVGTLHCQGVMRLIALSGGSCLGCATGSTLAVHGSIVEYSAVDCRKVKYNTVQYSAVQCRTVQCSAVQYNAVCTVQCRIV